MTPPENAEGRLGGSARILLAIERIFGAGMATRMLRGAGGFLFIHVASLGIAYLANAYIARRIGASGYGEFVYGVAWKSFLLVPAMFGLSVGALRFVAAYAGNEQWGLLRGFFAWSERLVLAASLAAALLFAAVVWLLRERFSADLVGVLLITAAALPLHAGLLLNSAKLRGLGRLLMSQAPHAIGYPVLQFGLVFVFGLSFAWQVAAADAVAIAAVCGALAVAASRAAPAAAHGVERKSDVTAWVAALAPLAWIDLVNAVMDRTDVLMLGAFVGTEQAGIYAVASRVGTIVTFGLVAGNAWAAPQFSERHARGETAELQGFVHGVARMILIFSVPAVGAVVLLGPFLLGMFGAEFRAGYEVLLLIAAGHLLSAVMGPVAYLTTMTGGQRDAAVILSLAALIGVVANWLLIPPFGAVGAASAALLARLFWNAAMAIRLYQRTGLRTFAL